MEDTMQECNANGGCCWCNERLRVERITRDILREYGRVGAENRIVARAECRWELAVTALRNVINAGFFAA